MIGLITAAAVGARGRPRLESARGAYTAAAGRLFCRESRMYLRTDETRFREPEAQDFAAAPPPSPACVESQLCGRNAAHHFQCLERTPKPCGFA